MSNLLLIPLEDSVVFPNMSVTLTVEVGDVDRVFLVPLRDGEYARVGTVAAVADTLRLPGGGRAVTLTGLHRGIAGAAHTGPDGRLRVEVEERPDEQPPRVQTAELEREYRAVVEEILDLRDADARITTSCARSPKPARSPTPPPTRPTSRSTRRSTCSRRSTSSSGSSSPLRLQRERLAELQVRRRIREDVESGAQKQQREYVLRSQLDSIRKELGEDEALRRPTTTARSSPSPACRRQSASRPSASSPASSGSASPDRRVADDPHLPRLAARRAVGRALRGPARPRARARRCWTPTTRASRTSRTGSSSTWPSASCGRSAAIERRPALRRDPHPDRPARDGQDLDRRVDRPRARPRVRPDVARRRSRRGRDPRPPPHLHRRAARPARARAARRGDDEPGDPARRGRQARRRLARRPLGRAARGARPGAEPHLPRPLPRRGARPLAGVLHRDGERRGEHPRAAARPHGGHPASTATPSTRSSRSHATTSGRGSSTATACARTRSWSPTRCSAPS